MRYIVTVQTENYDPSLPQTDLEPTEEQYQYMGKALCKACLRAFKNPALRDEYNRWLKEQKEKIKCP